MAISDLPPASGKPAPTGSAAAAEAPQGSAAESAVRSVEVGENRGPTQGAVVTPSGVEFTTWAPRNSRATLALTVDGRRQEMSPIGDGFYRLVDPRAGVGSRYHFDLVPFRSSPDMASLSQPDGVVGGARVDSEVVDPARIPRRNVSFGGRPLSEMVIEQIHVGTYTPEGTFTALKGRLRELKADGIKDIQLMPINPFMGRRGIGYDSILIRAPHAAYGTVAELMDLIDEAHGLGLTMGCDLQFNHTPWEENFSWEFGPYESETDTEWGRGMNLDGPLSGPVRKHLLDSLRYLLGDPPHGLGFDFVRLDAFHRYSDASTPHIGSEIAELVNQLGRETGKHKHVVAEDDSGRPPQRFGIHAQWVDGAAHNSRARHVGHTHKYLASFGKPGQTRDFLRGGYIYLPEQRRAREWEGMSPDRMIHFLLGNHDRTMNDGLGQQTTSLIRPHLLGWTEVQQALAATVPMYWQGARGHNTQPFYYFTDYQDAAKARGNDLGRADEFPPVSGLPAAPPPSAESTFLASKVPDRSQLDARALAWNAQLLALRAKHGIGAAWPSNVHEHRAVDGTRHVITFSYPKLRITGNEDPNPNGPMRRGLWPGEFWIEEKRGGRWYGVAPRAVRGS